MAKAVTRDAINAHRLVATQVETLYQTIDVLAKKKPTERITPLIAKKINHVITRVRDQIANDPFLDAIDTVSLEPAEQIRFDEAFILLAELRSTLDRQWRSAEYVEALRELFGALRPSQTM